MTGQGLSEGNKAALPEWGRVILFTISYLVLGGIFQIAGILIAGVPLADLESMANLTPYQIILLQFLGFIPLIILVYLFRKFIDRKSIKSLGFSLENRTIDIVAGFALALLSIGGGTLFLYSLGYIYFIDIQFDFLILLKINHL